MAGLAGLASLASPPGAAVGLSAAPLRCTVTAPANIAAGQAVPLQWMVTNTGLDALDFLAWGTPFEGWFAPYVALRRGGTVLVYGGPSAKRGDPQAQEYVHLPPGQSRQAVVDLAPVFDLRVPGRYRLQPQIVLHDVVLAAQGVPPRPRGQHAAQALACPSLEFTVGS